MKTIEFQQVMTVLGEMLDKLNFISLVPQKSYPKLIKIFKDNNNLNIIQSLNNQWHAEEVVRESNDIERNSLVLAQNQVIDFTRKLNHTLITKPSLIKTVYESCEDSRSKSILKLMDALSELIDIINENHEHRSKAEVPSELSSQGVSDGKNNSEETISSLENKILQIQSNAEKETSQLDNLIQKSKKQIDFYKQKFAAEKNTIEVDMKKSLNFAYEEHTVIMNQLLEKTAELDEQKKTLDKKHEEEEIIWRKKISKSRMEIKNLIKNYDTEMMDYNEKLSILEKDFEKENKELIELKEYFQKIDDEQARIEEEERVIALIRDKELEAENKLINMATIIQKIIRGRIDRQKYKKLQMKAKKKKKKKKEKNN